MNCAKCGGEMKQGVEFDAGSRPPAYWAEKIEFWKGPIGRHEIASYRCLKCGYIESYALPPEKK